MEDVGTFLDPGSTFGTVMGVCAKDVLKAAPTGTLQTGLATLVTVWPGGGGGSKTWFFRSHGEDHRRGKETEGFPTPDDPQGVGG